MSDDFSHLNESGEVRMVDVGAKAVTERMATARAEMILSAETKRRLFANDMPKGDALATVRIAAIMAVKRTPELIPLCHPLSITGVEVGISESDTGADIEVTVSTSGQTGVEMEAMTGCTVGALALYDMVKGLDRFASIGAVRLLAKSGGASGTWTRQSD